MTAPPETDVLIAGAGPTGLVLAIWLTRLGVRVRIIDKTAEAATASRALAVQARTLEFYGQLGFADEVVARGRQVHAISLWVRGRRVAHAPFGNMGAGLSPYPYVLIFPQDEHERLLIEHLASLGVRVERQTELLSFDETADGVLARLKLPDCTEQTCRAAYLAGCDGARSTVRQQLHIGFPGGQYTHVFYVADVQATGPVANGEINIALDRADFLAVFPLHDDGRLRLVGTVRDDAPNQNAELTWDDVSQRVLSWLRLDVTSVHWFSTYRVHHRVADHFRHGRAFLLGDAAHIHSPVGGQGMNTGIGDAVNLAWKLANVLHRRAPATILDTYEPERIAFARRLVATTDRAFTAVTSSKPLARFFRLHVAPRLVPALFSTSSTRRFMFRTAAQITIQYRDSTLSDGSVGAVHGGDRLPWVQTADNHAGNFAPLSSLDWQVHIYGLAPPDLDSLCDERKIPLHVFPWDNQMARAGLRPNALYLVRPDGYVAFVSPQGSSAALAQFLDARGLLPPA